MKPKILILIMIGLSFVGCVSEEEAPATKSTIEAPIDNVNRSIDWEFSVVDIYWNPTLTTDDIEKLRNHYFRLYDLSNNCIRASMHDILPFESHHEQWIVGIHVGENSCNYITYEGGIEAVKEELEGDARIETGD